MDECRRSGQIPAFGNWDYANELPITQYFESARQAGLIRYCSSAGECDLPTRSGDLYDAVEFNNKPHLRTSTTVVVSSRKKRGSKNSRRISQTAQVKEESKVVRFKVEDVDVQKYSHSQQQQPQKKKQQQYFEKEMIKNNNNYHYSRQPTATASFKPVDEDLYKIPPELLHTSKRKKMLGFLSRCLVPGCIV